MWPQSAGVLLKQLVPEAHGFSLQSAGAGERPPITCHVLDTATGTPAVGLGVLLARCEDGTRCAPLSETLFGGVPTPLLSDNLEFLAYQLTVCDTVGYVMGCGKSFGKCTPTRMAGELASVMGCSWRLVFTVCPLTRKRTMKLVGYTMRSTPSPLLTSP